jgi:hypothetical protein
MKVTRDKIQYPTRLAIRTQVTERLQFPSVETGVTELQCDNRLWSYISEFSARFQKQRKRVINNGNTFILRFLLILKWQLV